jgi:hypothetical protein
MPYLKRNNLQTSTESVVSNITLQMLPKVAANIIKIVHAFRNEEGTLTFAVTFKN